MTVSSPSTSEDEEEEEDAVTTVARVGERSQEGLEEGPLTEENDIDEETM